MSILPSFSVVFNLGQESRIKIPSCHKGKDDTSLMSTDQTLGVFFFFFKILTIGPRHVSEKGNVIMHFCTACLLNPISPLQFELWFFSFKFCSLMLRFQWSRVAPHFDHGWFHSVTAHRFPSFFSGFLLLPSGTWDGWGIPVVQECDRSPTLAPQRSARSLLCNRFVNLPWPVLVWREVCLNFSQFGRWRKCRRTTGENFRKIRTVCACG